MGKVKELMMELADHLGKEFEEITQDDIQRNFESNAQKVWSDLNSSYEELMECKQFLRTKKWSEVKFYDAETGTPKFKIGSVLTDGDGIIWLIVKD